MSTQTPRILSGEGLAGRLARSAGAAILRFPAATLFILVFTMAANKLVADPNAPDDVWRLLPALASAAAAATAVHLALERRTVRGILALVLPTFVGLAVCVTVFRSDVLLVEGPLLLLAAMLAVPLAPFLFRPGDGGRYWTFFLWGAAGAGLAFVAVLVSISGLTTILEIFRLFFGLGLSFEAYTHIFVTALGLIGPLFALASLPATGAAAPVFDRDDRLIRLVRPLLEWIAPALLLLQGLVLHLYAPIAMLGGEGLVDAGLLSTTFLIGVITLRVAIDPFIVDLSGLGRVFFRLWLWLVPVPLLMVLRVAYEAKVIAGVDPTSYVLWSIAVAVTAVLLLQTSRRSRDDIVAISAVPVAFMLVAAVGPLSLANVVGRSQASLIEARYGDDVRSGSLIPDAERLQMREALRTLAEVDQIDRLAPILGAERVAAIDLDGASSSSVVVDRLLALLGAPDESTKTVEEPELRILAGRDGRAMSLEGFDRGSFSRTVEVGLSYNEGSDPSLRFEGNWLVVGLSGVEDRVDLEASIEGLPPALFDASDFVEPPVVELESEGGRALRLRFEYLSVGKGDTPEGGRISLLWRNAEWASLGGG